jgi:molecular chaperone GrpE
MGEENKKQEGEEKQEETKEKEEIEEKSNSSEEQKEEKEEKKEECKELEEEIEQLKEKLAKTEEAAKRLSMLYQKLEKEFEDYKIRVRREKEEAKDEGALRILNGFIEIVDNFEKALESTKTATDINAFIKGVQMIHYQLTRFLQDHGIEKVSCEGEFNPQEHEAIETLKTDEYQPNSIVKVIQTGYKYKGKVIRPAKVVVAVEKEKGEEKG